MLFPNVGVNSRFQTMHTRTAAIRARFTPYYAFAIFLHRLVYVLLIKLIIIMT